MGTSTSPSLRGALLLGLTLALAPSSVIAQFGGGFGGQRPGQGQGQGQRPGQQPGQQPGQRPGQGQQAPGQGQQAPGQGQQAPGQAAVGQSQDRQAGGTPTFNLTTDDKCGCFKTNTSSGQYFANHHFIDFRSLVAHVRTPSVLADVASNTNARESADFFTHTNFSSVWSPQSWNNNELMKMNNSDVSGSDATLLMVNSKNNIYIERNTDPGATSQTYMVMRTARLPNFQTSAEIESISTGYRFVSVRMHARTRGAKGAITAMFTYRPGINGALASVQEADLEIRTNDPNNRVQFTNQPSWNAAGDIPAATRNVTMPSRVKWSDWATYRMDWTPGSTSWYVNGQLASTITFQAPRDPSQIMFNSWSDGGTWSGTMPLNESASLEIQWIEMVFNNTDKNFAPKPGPCTQTCSIDETPEIGTPVLIVGNTGATQGGQNQQGGNRQGGQQGGQAGQGGNRQGGNQGGQAGQGGNRQGGQQGGQAGQGGNRQGGQQGGQAGQGGNRQGGNQGGQAGQGGNRQGGQQGGQAGQGGQGGNRQGGNQGGQAGQGGNRQGGQQGGQNGQGGNRQGGGQGQGGSQGTGAGAGSNAGAGAGAGAGGNAGAGSNAGAGAGTTAGTGAACAIAKYGQCGGKNWKGSGGQNCGSFTCSGGATCKSQNEYYSQCL